MNLLEECRGAAKIGISGHTHPDGDCVGSCMGLYLYLRRELPEADIRVFLERPPEVFSCIRGIEAVDSECKEEILFDVFFVLDTAYDRLGKAEKYFHAALRTVNIDHHISNSSGCAAANYVDPAASSASELVYRLIGKAGLDRDIAQALYIGIIHDTGVLQYSNTKPETLLAVADLISFGFDFTRIIEETFYEKTYLQTQILGRALLESFVFLDGQCVVSVIDRKTMRFYGAGTQDLEGIVSQLRNIKGVECAVFLYEIGTLKFKVSLRSGNIVNVAAIAEKFGGGGHVRAAGCTMCGTYHDVINNLSPHIARQLEEGASGTG